MKVKEIQENLELVQNVLGQWLRYRQYYLKGVSEEPISPQEEQEFLETTSSIAQNVRKLGQRIDEKKFPIRKNEIGQQLKGTISIQHFRNLSAPDRKAFYAEWYTSMVYLTRTVGAFKFLNEGYRPPEAKKGKKGAGKKKGAKSMVIALVVIIIVVLGGYFAYENLF